MEREETAPLRDRLNEYQLDWVQAAVRSKLLNLDSIRGKKILLIGDDSGLADAVAWSFEAWNDCRQAGVSVAHMFSDGGWKRYAGASFKPEEADYVIFVGFCCREIRFSATEMVEYLGHYLELMQSVTKFPCARILLLSDYRVYGQLRRGFAASEYEAGKTDPYAEGSEAQYFLQALESILISCARENHASYQILRTGILFGACLETMEQSIYTLARMVAEGCAGREKLSVDRSSYVSIHDVLTAVQFVLTRCPANKIFNVTGMQADASDSELVEILYRNFPDSCKISLEWEAPKDICRGKLLNTQLLQRYGFLPEVSLEDGLIILVKSLQKQNGIFIFDNTYLGKLTTVHQILLGYLLEIDRICRKHNIKYFLAGGTLLGAIRHHGFIPWDDDADVMMLREDYDHFLEIVQEELPGNIFLQIPSTEKGNYNAFAKLRINDTMFSTLFTAQFLDMHNGIFFDILAHDKTGNNKLTQKMHLDATMLARTLVFRKWGEMEHENEGRHPLACAVVNRVKKFVPMPFAEWLQKKMLRFYQHRRSRYLYDGMGKNLGRGPFPAEWLDEAVYVDFEGYKLPVPREYDKYLTWLYGDYMQMIPVSERRTSHCIVMTDLGAYSDYKCRSGSSVSE